MERQQDQSALQESRSSPAPDLIGLPVPLFRAHAISRMRSSDPSQARTHWPLSWVIFATISLAPTVMANCTNRDWISMPARGGLAKSSTVSWFVPARFPDILRLRNHAGGSLEVAAAMQVTRLTIENRYQRGLMILFESRNNRGDLEKERHFHFRLSRAAGECSPATAILMDLHHCVICPLLCQPPKKIVSQDTGQPPCISFFSKGFPEAGGVRLECATVPAPATADRQSTGHREPCSMHLYGAVSPLPRRRVSTVICAIGLRDVVGGARGGAG